MKERVRLTGTMGGAEAIHLLEETRSMTHRNSPLTPAGERAWSNVSKMMVAPSPTSLPRQGSPARL